MNKLRSINNRFSDWPKRAIAQSMVEFAIALPVLLLLVFGIIEFGRMMQAYLALENGARFAVRYAITGSFNSEYCDDAAIALATDPEYDGIIEADPEYNCDLGDTTDQKLQDWEAALQDWARLPSIRDAAIQGATGVSWINDTSIIGDYLAYLTNASSTRTADNRGNPSIPGYLSVSICSDRPTLKPSQFAVNPNPLYYPGHDGENNYLFPEFCNEQEVPNGTIIKYIDDAGGPGNRVRVVLTYRHNLITPLLSSWWPSLRLTSQREGIVEQYRTSRVTGLSGGIAYSALWTSTGTQTSTPSETPTPTKTSTETPTNTPTNTSTNTATPTNTPPAVYCANAGSVLRQKFSNVSGSGISALTNHVNYPESPDLTDYRTLFEIEVHDGIPNDFGTRMRAYLCPPFTGDYTFYISSDDKGELWLSTIENSRTSVSRIARITGWTTSRLWNKKVETEQKSAPKHLEAGKLYYIEALMKEEAGGDNLAIGWTLPGFLESPAVIAGQYLVPVTPEPIVPTGTATRVMTATASATFTVTNTPLPTNTPVPTNTPDVAATQTRAARRLTRTAEAIQTQTAQVPLTQTAASIQTKTERAELTQTSAAETATERAEQTQTSVALTATARYTPPTSTYTATPSNTPQPQNTPTPSRTPTRTATCATPFDLGGCR